MDFGTDEAGRLAAVQRFDAATGTAITPLVPLLYDGRSFLTHAGDLATSPTTRPVYDSAGLLMALRRQASAADPELTDEIFYFAGRPVAQLELGGAVPQWSYFTTDHLGTPQVATDETGVEIWSGGSEPFGRDAQEATPAGALANGVFLRFPGQWETESWQEATLGAGVYYNVNRWYEAGEGRYTSPDPLGVQADVNLYLYAGANPVCWLDPLGFTKWQCTIAGLTGAFALAGVAGLAYWLECTSECYAGSQTIATYRAGSAGIGAGVRGSLPFGVTHMTFDDGLPGRPWPQQLSGDFCVADFSIIVGGGFSLSRVRLGGAVSKGLSDAWGLGANLFFGCGSAKYTGSTSVPCCNGPTGDRPPEVRAPDVRTPGQRETPIITAAPP